jgi:hypothetical protein
MKGTNMKWFSGSGVRTAVIAGGVAAVTALVITGSPAFAQRSAPAAGGTPIIITGSGTHTILLAGKDNFVTLGKLHLAAGGWTIFAKAEVTAVTVELHCKLSAGVNSDAVNPQIIGSSSGRSGYQEVVLNMAHVFRAVGVVTFACNGSGVSGAIFDVKMTAIKAGSLKIVKL